MTHIEKVLSIASAEVGYLEKASNKDLDSKTANAGMNNMTKYSRDVDKIPDFYNTKKQGAAYCDIFVDWCMIQAFGVDNALKLLCQPTKSLGAGVKYSAQYYKAKGRWFTSPKAGDQIFFKNSSNGNLVHTGLVEKVANNRVYTIEGNTSTASGVVANGGGVARKSYALSYSRIAGYGRPDYDGILGKPSAESNPVTKPTTTPTTSTGGKIMIEMKQVHKGDKGAEVKALQALLKGYGYTDSTKKVLVVDGDFGNNTDYALKKYQKDHGLEADGYCGAKTWNKLMRGI